MTKKNSTPRRPPSARVSTQGHRVPTCKAILTVDVVEDHQEDGEQPESVDFRDEFPVTLVIRRRPLRLNDLARENGIPRSIVREYYAHVIAQRTRPARANFT